MNDSALDSGLELAAGDRVLCTRNDRRLAVANGSRGTVVEVDQYQRAVVVELDDRRRLLLPARYLDAGNVSHAYALTGHKTQGLTVERTFVLADDHRALKEWGYVALSRARGHTRLYTIAAEREPDAPPHRPEPAGPVDRLADALTRPVADTLAVDAVAVRNGSSGPGDRALLARQARALAEQRRALEKERTHAARQLHKAIRELADMGAIGRGRHGRSLREQISEREDALTRLDRELDRLDHQLHEARQRALELAPTQPRLERGLTREPSLGRSLEREIEL